MHNAKKAKEEEKDDVSLWEGDKVSVKSSELSLGQKIAEGNFGIVYKGKCRGQPVAIKLLNNQELSKNEKKLQELKTEVEIMTRLRHPCIVLLMGICVEPGNIALVMELIDGKSLGDILHNQIELTLEQKLRIASGIAKGVNWLHCLSPPIVHRDLKPPNILVSSNFDVKVCDFGLSCVKEPFDPSKPPAETAVGTPIWMAPEILQGLPHSEKSDVYAYGLILWEIFTREIPFSHCRSFRQFNDEVLGNVRPALNRDSIPVDLRPLIEACWHMRAARRPSFGQIIEALDEVSVNSLIKDADGRRIWSSLRNEHVEDYPFLADWEKFYKTFAGWFKRSSDSTSSPVYHCLKELLTEIRTGLTSSGKREIITCENFGRFAEVFGPLNSSVFPRFESLCASGAFHGSIDSNEATRRLTLAGLKLGDYIIRLSSKDNCLTITKVAKKGAVNHQRIYRKDDNYVIKLESGLQSFETVDQLIDKAGDELGLKRACHEDSTYAAFFGFKSKVQNEIEQQYLGGSTIEAPASREARLQLSSSKDNDASSSSSPDNSPSPTAKDDSSSKNPKKKKERKRSVKKSNHKEKDKEKDKEKKKNKKDKKE